MTGVTVVTAAAGVRRSPIGACPVAVIAAAVGAGVPGLEIWFVPVHPAARITTTRTKTTRIFFINPNLHLRS